MRFTNILLPLFLCLSSSEAKSQTDCFSSDSVSDLVECLSKTWPKKDVLTFEQWKATVPTYAERTAFYETVLKVLSSDMNCEKIKIPTQISNEVEIKLFKNKYCILLNKNINPKTKLLSRPWALVAVPRNLEDRLNLVHHSAPHFYFDSNSANQAAAVFEQSNSYSLIVSAIGRYATLEKQGSCQKKYFPADGAHSNVTMFHTALVASHQWQMQQKQGCSFSNCAFVQWHGKGPRTCPKDSAFISTGAKNSTGFYDKIPPIPAVKLATAIGKIWKRVSPELKVSTPRDSSCTLLARTNIFGRVVNGVKVEDACRRWAKKYSGTFVHIEQSSGSRNEAEYTNWANAIKDTFGK